MFSLYSGIVYSQSAELTPISDLGTHSVTVQVPIKFISSFPGVKTLQVPTNYTVSVFHAGGLAKPRFMSFSPTGVLHVSDMNAGRVFALPDANMDGVADTMIEAASGFSGNHDIKFYKGAMYVTESSRVWKCTDLNSDGVYETKVIFINNIGNGLGGHTTRTIVFDSINQKVYVSIGSSCNVCRETERAIIEVYNEDGSGGRDFATGVRNAVGMALHPVTNRLWANNNGSDQQGNETPPEWIDLVRDNGFYGHPFAYGSGVWFNFNAHANYQALLPITATDSAMVKTLVPPAALIRAHSAPMALEFLTSQFGTSMQYGFLSALRGSWNTTNPKDFRGYKVIYGHLSSAQDTTVDYVADFCSGFITDTVNRTFWGRPVGIAIDKEGKVFISSDEGNRFVLVLTPDKISGEEEMDRTVVSVNVFPNPVRNQFTVSIALQQPDQISMVLNDVFGREVKHFMDWNLSNGKHDLQADMDGLAPGNYFLKLRTKHHSITKKIVLVN